MFPVWQGHRPRGWARTGRLAIVANGQRVGVDAEDAVSPAEFVFSSTKADIFYLELPEERWAHETGPMSDRAHSLAQ